MIIAHDWFGSVTMAPFTWGEAGTLAALLLISVLLGKVIAGVFDSELPIYERGIRVMVVGGGLATVGWIIIPALFVIAKGNP